jgi:hypothetical protein
MLAEGRGDGVDRDGRIEKTTGANQRRPAREPWKREATADLELRSGFGSRSRWRCETVDDWDKLDTAAVPEKQGPVGHPFNPVAVSRIPIVPSIPGKPR